MIHSSAARSFLLTPICVPSNSIQNGSPLPPARRKIRNNRSGPLCRITHTWVQTWFAGIYQGLASAGGLAEPLTGNCHLPQRTGGLWFGMHETSAAAKDYNL